MLVWTSIISRPKQRSLLSASGWVLAFLFAAYLADFYGWSLPWVIGVTAVGLFTLRSVGSAMWFLARHPLASCDLGLTEAAFPGGAVRCALRLRARKPVRIGEIGVRLTARQKDADGTVRALFRTAQVLAADVSLKAGESFEAAGELPIPGDAPASYRVEERQVRWLVRARVATVGFPAPEEELVIPVVPLP